MVASLLRLQLLAFWRAPYLGGRIALALAKGAGVAYAVGAAAILGFVLPDLLGAVAPGLPALASVDAAVLPALAVLLVGRQVFQDVPTRGATAFLTLPVSRQRVAAAVLLRSATTPFGVVPLAFAVPFAARAVRAEAGAPAAWAFGLAVLALVVVSHALLVVWKTRLGARPVRTIGVVAGTVGLVAALEGATGGLMAHVRAGGLGLAVLGALAAATLVLAYHALVAALYLDAGGSRRASAARAITGLDRGGTRAFLDLDRRLVTRATFPRSVLANAAVVSVVLTVGALLARRHPAGAFVPTELVLLFSTGPVAGSFGQYAVSFASGYTDRLLTLPGGVEAFVRAKWAGVVVATVTLGVVQAGLVFALASDLVDLVGVSVVFSLGVLAPAALWGATLGPKPLDVSERLLFVNTQSFGAQLLVGSTAALAGGVLSLAGPDRGALVAAALGLVGILLTPLWLRALVRRIHRRRHVVAARFRSAL
ncbi:DUF5687 family protein [Rubrivirga marina]|uniref:Uncharacterized protein n=1 Tax=Rubrivirga marina TaxID=1196024 RepID=A0A271J4S3_9BACT|nr:DUF5687 family protein [Rubrivirga marina]PAP78512.1 hypothetical protein BSZ37_19820 [Rubrivirga marina]